MIDFRDFDPEDAYDIGDDPDTKVVVLERVVADLRARRLEDRFEARRTDALRVLFNATRQRDADIGRLVTLRAELEAL